MQISHGAGGDATCLVLVDYDNAFPPNRGYTDEEVGREVTGWLQSLSARFPEVNRFEVRLYGGWYDDVDLSKHGSDVASAMAQMPQFPLVNVGGRIVRGDVSLAVVPITSRGASPLLGTYRKKGALPRVRLAGPGHPEACAQPDERCPAHILKSFTKTANRVCPVAACSIAAKDAFVVHEQKMVDTLLATDVLAAAWQEASYPYIAVVSGDSDFLPPLLAAQANTSSTLVQVVPRNEEASAYAMAQLGEAGIEIMETVK